MFPNKLILLLTLIVTSLFANTEELNLTQEEQEYITSKKIIKMCNNPNWAPLEFTLDGKFENMQGIAIDTVKYLEEKLDIKFQNIATKSWSESQQFLKEKKCDLLPCAVETRKRKEYANFTKPYLNLPLAIFTTKDKKIVSGLDEIMDKPWTRQKSSGLITKLRQEYPDMKVIETKGDREALMFVNSGKAYFTIATLPVASHVISKFMLNDLHIAGYTGIVYDLSMAIRDDDLTLLSVIDKTLQNMSKETEKSIFRKWVSASVKEPITDYSLLWKVLVAVFIIGVFMTYRQLLLKRANLELKVEIKKALDKNTKQLQLMQQQSKMASMGEMIGAIAHQWRQPLTAVSSSIQNLPYAYEDGDVDEKFIKEFTAKNKKIIKFMSKTIDDFRNFFRVDKIKKSFDIKEAIDDILNMQSAQLKKYKIDCEVIGEEFEIVGYKSEFMQVILNIVNNSKDAIIENEIQNPTIKIEIQNQQVVITDNGGGMSNKIMNRIFEPYFTTKDQGSGTGMGLYMAKIIIEENMNGKLTTDCIDTNSIFTISFDNIQG